MKRIWKQVLAGTVATAAGDHMVRTLVDLAARGERVLAVVGASHAIRQEPALAKAVEQAVSRVAAGGNN